MKDYQAGVTAPPFHVWCRSTTVPYFDDFNEGATRAARGEDGKTYQVPADMKYDEWKRKFVDNVSEQRIIKLAKESGIRGKISIPSKRINTSGYSFDDTHINEIRKHGVSLEDAQRYIDNALVSFTRYNGRFECYFSSDGATYVDVQNKKIRTAFKREQYDSKTLQFIKGVEDLDPLPNVE